MFIYISMLFLNCCLSSQLHFYSYTVLFFKHLHFSKSTHIYISTISSLFLSFPSLSLVFAFGYSVVEISGKEFYNHRYPTEPKNIHIASNECEDVVEVPKRTNDASCEFERMRMRMQMQWNFNQIKWEKL